MPKQFISSAGVSAPSDPKLASPVKLFALLGKATEWVILIATAIIPLFFLSFTSQALEFPKQIALLVLCTFAVLAWIGSVLVEKAIVLRRSVANAAAGLFLVAIALSAFFSNAKYVSIVGDSGQEYLSLMTVALFAILFFVIVNLPQKTKIADKAILVFVVVTGLASLQALFLFAGVKILPFITNQSFNLIGSTVTLGLLAAVAVVAACVYLLIEDLEKRALAKRIVAAVFGLFSLGVVLVINFWPIWTAAIVGLVAVLAYALVRPNAIRRLTWLAVPMGVLVLAALFMVINIPMPVHAPTEIFPSMSQSLGIAGGTLKNDPVFGSGPGTYAQDFSQFRNAVLNKSAVWYLRFDRGDSYLLTLLATTGFAGAICWLALVVIGLWKSAAYLIYGKERDDENWLIVLCLSAAFLASAIGTILYGASLATLFIFWLLFALLIRAVSHDVVTIRFSDSPRAALGMTFFFVIVIILSISGWFVTGTKLYADTLLARASTQEVPKQIDSVIDELTKAASANQQSDQIFRSLAQAYLVDIQTIINDQKMDATTRGQKVNNLTMGAVNAAKEATIISPKEVSNWSMLATVYEAVSAYVSDAPASAIAAYDQASLLEPASPVYHLGLGRVHVILADRAASDVSAAKDDASKATAQKTETDELAAAETEFGKALELKSDYAQASYQLALVYAQQGKADQAIKKLEEVAAANPNDAGVAYELGILYYQAGTKDKAQAEFERAIAISPDYADAHWLLATVYEDAKDYTNALAQLNAILKTDPTNDTVKKRIVTVTDEMNGKTPPAPETGATAPLPQKTQQ
jgi:tetratricopeptide (TPR) repeat protein